MFFDLHVKKKEQPVELKVNFSDIPKELIAQTRCFQVKSHYFWDLKQASCIKFDNNASNILMNLKAENYDLLWASYEKSMIFYLKTERKHECFR